MTACAIEPATEHEDGDAPRAGCTITADGSYAARLALDGESWFPERWTLDGPEPYAVPLPAHQPEEPGTELQPMGDGRVLICRPTDGRHIFSLLYPTGPGTGELLLGAVQCPPEQTRLRLLPPAPGGGRAYALAVGRHSSAVWLVAGVRSGRSRSRRSRGAARAGCGWTGAGGYWLSTVSARSPGAVRRPSWSIWSAAARSPSCCRSRTTATTGCCSPTRTAGCC